MTDQGRQTATGAKTKGKRVYFMRHASVSARRLALGVLLFTLTCSYAPPLPSPPLAFLLVVFVEDGWLQSHILVHCTSNDAVLFRWHI